jgi:hypothetical protein
MNNPLGWEQGGNWICVAESPSNIRVLNDIVVDLGGVNDVNCGLSVSLEDVLSEANGSDRGMCPGGDFGATIYQASSVVLQHAY